MIPKTGFTINLDAHYFLHFISENGLIAETAVCTINSMMFSLNRRLFKSIKFL